MTRERSLVQRRKRRERRGLETTGVTRIEGLACAGLTAAETLSPCLRASVGDCPVASVHSDPRLVERRAGVVFREAGHRRP